MDNLILKYQQLLKAYNRLDYMIETFKKLSQTAKPYQSNSKEENELITHRDALIKRFEFCYDLTWKYLKAYLKEKLGLEVLSPKKVFNECYHQNLISESEVTMLLGMADSRNETAHIYDEDIADAISKKILDYYPVIKEISKRLATAPGQI